MLKQRKEVIKKFNNQFIDPLLIQKQDKNSKQLLLIDLKAVKPITSLKKYGKVTISSKFQPSKTSNNQCIIGHWGPDKRQLANITQYPYSAIGILLSTWKWKNGQKKTSYGTAFLISNNLALTAAHNVYSRQQQIIPQKIILSLGQMQKTKSNFEVSFVYIPSQYQKKYSIQVQSNDYALIVFNTQNQQNLKQKYGYLSINMEITANQLLNKMIYIYGYPFDKNLEMNPQMQTRKQIDMNVFGFQDNINQIRGVMIRYKIDTNYGQSGSPILIKSNQGQYVVVGVHTSRCQMNMANKGPMLQKQARAKINKWIINFLQQNQQKKNIKINHKINQISIFKSFVEEWLNNAKQKWSIYTNILNQKAIQRLKSKFQNKKEIDISSHQYFLSNTHLLKLLSRFKVNENIQQIQLLHNSIGNQGLVYLIESINQFQKLNKIDLSDNPIGNRGVISILNSHSKFPLLNQLWLRKCNIGQIQQKFLNQKLTSFANFPNLSILDLSHNILIDEDIRLLFNSNGLQTAFANLTQIWLNNNQLKGQAIKYLSFSSFANLSHLSLQNNKINLKKVQLIQNNNTISFPRLSVLQLSFNQLCNQSIQVLVDCCLFKTIKRLYLDGNINIRQNGIQNLLQNLNILPYLKQLDISYCHMDSQRIKQSLERTDLLFKLQSIFIFENQ